MRRQASSTVNRDTYGILAAARKSLQRSLKKRIEMNEERFDPESVPSDLREQYQDLITGCVDVLPSEDLLARLVEARREGRPLRAKLGVDPTAPDIHLGHTVVLRKLAQFQSLGHTAVLIIGDYTAKVGDPSGRSKARPQLTEEEISRNAQTYVEQAGRVLDMSRVELVRNSEWLAPLRMDEVLRLTATTTVARMLERDDFANRYQANEPISVLEFMYPLLQGYDSVAVKADVELGGTDQKFNLLMGRTIMEAYGLRPQGIMTVPLLVGTDGAQKMSKTYGNYIGVTEPPEEMFGKVMSIPDGLMVTYWTLLTGAGHREIEDIQRRLDKGAYHPAEAKRDLAERIVAAYHDEKAARRAREHFDRVFREGQLPEEVPEATLTEELVRDGRVWIPRLLKSTGLASRMPRLGA
ncbi:MAG: tyrosine--tRNA ligase [Thermoleophilia bacterium]